jgi:hypothetical protein
MVLTKKKRTESLYKAVQHHKVQPQKSGIKLTNYKSAYGPRDHFIGPLTLDQQNELVEYFGYEPSPSPPDFNYPDFPDLADEDIDAAAYNKWPGKREASTSPMRPEVTR